MFIGSIDLIHQNVNRILSLLCAGGYFRLVKEVIKLIK